MTILQGSWGEAMSGEQLRLPSAFALPSLPRLAPPAPPRPAPPRPALPADIGGISPGSMPPHSHSLVDEGAAIISFKLVQGGR